MAVQNESPYVAHVEGWKGEVRVPTSGCLGLCTKEPNVMIYTRKAQFSEVSQDDVNTIILVLQGLMTEFQLFRPPVDVFGFFRISYVCN